MLGEHRYRLQTTWAGNRGSGTSGYRDYDRAVTIEIDGKPTLNVSSDKPFRGDLGIPAEPYELIYNHLMKH